MGYLQLGESDREKYGVPERVAFVNHRFGMRAIKALRVATGYDYEILARLLGGVPKVDPVSNEPVYEVDDAGERILDEDNNPVLALTIDEDVIAAYCWLILWSAGYKLDWKTFDLDPVGLVLDALDDDAQAAAEADPGKGEAEPSSNTTTDPS